MYSGGPHAAAKSQKCRTCSPNSPSWARQSRERSRTQENRRSPDSGPLPSDAAGTAPPPFVGGLKGSAHSLHNGTAKGKRGQAPCPGRGTRTAAPASPAGPGRTPARRTRRLAPELGQGENTGHAPNSPSPHPLPGPAKSLSDTRHRPLQTPPKSCPGPRKDGLGEGGEEGWATFVSLCAAVRVYLSHPRGKTAPCPQRDLSRGNREERPPFPAHPSCRKRGEEQEFWGGASRPAPARLVHVRVLSLRGSLAPLPPLPAERGGKFAQVRQQKGQRRSPPRRPGPRDAPRSLPPAGPGSQRSSEAARSRSSSSSGSGGAAAASMLCRRSSCRSARSGSGRLHARGAALGEEGGGEGGRRWARPSSSSSSSSRRRQGGGWDGGSRLAPHPGSGRGRSVPRVGTPGRAGRRWGSGLASLAC